MSAEILHNCMITTGAGPAAPLNGGPAVPRMAAPAPHRATLNGRRCVITCGPDAVTAEFAGTDGSLSLPYRSIMCVQHWDRTVLLCARRGGRLYSYEIVSGGAAGIRGAVIGRCAP